MLLPTPLLLNEIPAGTPPLFHYTDAGGLLGMLQHQKLWMTNIHYQNDEQEYNYALRLLREILENQYSTDFGVYVTGVNPSEMSPIHSFSLSEERDSLSQWRGYCPNGGYAVSFIQEQLNTVIKREKLIVGKCIYSRKEQEDVIINDVIGFTPEAYAEAVERKKNYVTYKMPSNMDSVFLRTSGVIRSRIMRIAPLFKHASFSEEKEWRLLRSSVEYPNDYPSPISQIMAYHKQAIQVKIRTRKNLLIPYVEASLALDNDKPIGVHEIVVSPTPHKHLALEACKVLMQTINLDFPIKNQVVSSAIPYVNW